MCLKNAKPWSLTARLTVLYTLLVAFILLVIGWYLQQTLANTLAQDNRQFLEKEIQLLRTVLKEQPPNLARLADEQSEGVDLPVGRYYSRILDRAGRSLIATPGMEALPPLTAFPVVTEHPKVQTIADGRTLMLMTASSKSSPQQSIQIALDITQEAILLDNYRGNLIGALVLGLLFSILAALYIARRGLQPLTEMTRHMEGITATQLNDQLDPTDWPQELSTVATAFNAMLQRLAKSFAQLTQFSADLAHELRTPINNLMGETEVALAKPRTAEEYMEILGSNLEEFGRLSRIVETLLFLARVENTEISLRTTRLDGRAELEAVCSYHEALSDEKGIRMICQGQGFLDADGQLFKRVLSNLLLNALQYTPRGGEISVSVHSGADGSAIIRVQDTGFGIAAEHLPKVFDRFYRADPARSAEGTGLGLAIVKSIVDLHGGTMDINSTVGKGTVVSLYFPAQLNAEFD